MDSQVVLRDLYETQYGIYDHVGHAGGPPRPLASVALHPAEDVNKYSLLKDLMRLYVMKDINSIFHYTLDEFLDKPRDLIDMMIELSEDVAVQRKAQMDDVERKLNKVTG